MDESPSPLFMEQPLKMFLIIKLAAQNLNIGSQIKKERCGQNLP